MTVAGEREEAAVASLSGGYGEAVEPLRSLQPRRRIPTRYLISILTIVAIVAAWWVEAAIPLISTRDLPSPAVMYSTFTQLVEQGYAGVPLWDHILTSLRECLTGFAIGAGLGIPVGLAVGTWTYASAVVSPVLAFLRPIPPIAYFPLMILLFGIGEESKIILIASAAFFYMVLNVAAGVRGVQRDLILTGRMLGLSRLQVFTSVVMRAASPQIFVGIKVSLILSWAVVVAAELISSNKGVGYIVTDSATFFRVPDVYAGVILIGVIGALLEGVVTLIERPLLRWHGH